MQSMVVRMIQFLENGTCNNLDDHDQLVEPVSSKGAFPGYFTRAFSDEPSVDTSNELKTGTSRTPPTEKITARCVNMLERGTVTSRTDGRQACLTMGGGVFRSNSAMMDSRPRLRLEQIA